MVLDGGYEMITDSGQWPQIDCRVGETAVPRPAILELG